MVLIAVTYPYCQSDQARRGEKSDTGKPRYGGYTLDSCHQSCLRHPPHKGQAYGR
jgi:hypothetical protein